MQIIEWVDFLERGIPGLDKPVALTVGVFDGVHLGHKALIRQVVEQDAIPVAVTFREPVYKNEKAAFTIQSFEEKAAVMEELGVQILIVIDFTEDFSRISGIEFLETLLAHLNIGFFAVGANFRCGCGLDTDAQTIKNFFSARSVPVEIVPEVLNDGLPVSSSRIRAALADGDLELAQALIG